MLYYEDQKAEAVRKAEDIRKTRLPKYLDYLERVLNSNKASVGAYCVGKDLRCVALCSLPPGC